MTKPGNGSKPKHKAKAAARKKQPVSKKPAMKHKHKLDSSIDGLLRRQAAEIGRQRLPVEPETATAAGYETAAGTFHVSFESLTISYPEAMFRDTAESRLLLATTRSRFMREMLAVYDRYAEAARQRYNEMDSTVDRPPIQPMGLMLVDTSAVNSASTVDVDVRLDTDVEADDVAGAAV